MLTERRLLPNGLIPLSLWEPQSGILKMPTALRNIYNKTIVKHGLIELANERQYNDSPIGGVTLEDTKKHFAQSFDGSSARVQLAVLDPKNETNGTSNAFINTLAGNKVIIMDAPCGTGAATLTFVSTIAELREKQILPRSPLEIKVIGGEISVSARSFAKELFEGISAYLESQAIFISYHSESWDATSPISTRDLVRKIVIEAQSCSRSLVIIANFSGFLERNFDKAKQQIDEVLRYSSGPGSMAVWIEPQKNNVVKQGQLFYKVSQWPVVKTFMSIFELKSGDKPFSISSARFKRPININEIPRVNLAVISFELSKNEQL